MATAPSLQRTSSRRASRSSCSPTDSPVPYESPAGYIVPGPGLVTRRQPGGRAVLTSGVGISTSARVLERKAYSGFEEVLAWWRDEILEPTIAKLCARSDCRIDDSGSDRAVPTDTCPACASDDGEASRARDGRLLLCLGVARETRTRTEDTTIFRRGNQPLVPARMCLHFRSFSSGWSPVTCPANSAWMYG